MVYTPGFPTPHCEVPKLEIPTWYHGPLGPIFMAAGPPVSPLQLSLSANKGISLKKGLTSVKIGFSQKKTE